MKTLKSFFASISILSLFLLIPSCAVNPVTGKSQLMFMSEAQEIALGTQYDPSVVSTFGIYKDDALLNFITEKGNEMGKISHRPNLQYHFKVLDSPVINAFAVPGGYIYLTRGILAQFNNEAELMGVLGHEMGHVTARHTAQQQTKQQIGQVLLAGGMIASKQIYELAEVAMQGMQLLFLSFSRDNEREADRLGVEYSSKIGYDASKMADFFNVLEKMQMESSQGGVPTFMSTHPDPGDRYNAVKAKTVEWQAKLPGQTFAVNTNSYLKLIDGIVYGEDPRQGFVENNNFYHPELKFQFPVPAGWTLVNSPLQVQITPPDGNAALIFSMAKETTADAAAQQATTDLTLTVLENRNIRVNGHNALMLVSQQVTQSDTGEEQAIKLLSYFIEKDGLVFNFHGISSAADFNTYFKAFESTMANFTTLTNQTILNIKPDRIKVITINSASVSLNDAFKYYNVPQDKFQEMALLNDLELNHTLQKGDRIKVLAK
jgi:predicted Zn-dependent protease